MIGFELSPSGASLPPDPVPLAPFFRPSGGHAVALAEAYNNGVAVWTEVAADFAACLILDNDDPNLRLSWRETLVARLRNVYPIGQFNLSGSWGKLQSSGSGISGSYTGNRAISTGSTTPIAHVTVTRDSTYDVWVHYTARTSGGYVKVLIDGAQALVNEITDPASLGFKAFATYGAVDLQRRQTVKVASGLTGTHDIALSYGGAASPGGNAIMLEAVSTSADLSAPQILPPLWQPNTPYEMGDEVQMGGLFYAARANGTSGTVGPLHSSGIASDGALDWRADFRPTYPEFVAIDYASEREYALRFTVAGAATEVGGQTHGNDMLTHRDILLDGESWVPVSTGAGLSVGSHVTVHEETTWQTQAGVPVALCHVDRTISAGAITHQVNAEWTGLDAQLEWFYAGMMPMVHWDGESQSTVVDTVSYSDVASVALASYAGVSPPNEDFPNVGALGLSGTILGTGLTYGCRAAATIKPDNRVDQFSAFLRPNLDARTASGGLDWTAKAYISAELSGNQICSAGDVLAFSNLHRITMG